MKHYADNNTNKNNDAPLYVKQPNTGGRYARKPDKNGRYVNLYESISEKIASLKSKRAKHPQNTEPQAAEAHSAPPEASEPQNVEPQPSGYRPARLRDSDPQQSEPQQQASDPPPKRLRASDPQDAETQSSDYRPARLRDSDPQNSETQDNTEQSAAAKDKTKVFPVKKREKQNNDSKSSAFADNDAENVQKITKRTRTQCAATPTAPVPETKAGYAPAFLFAGFIILMALWFIIAPKQSYSASEKRVLADFPETNAESVFSGEFGKDFEKYFADHFPSRNMWVGVNAYTDLIEGNNGANGVYKCSDGYLINKPVSTENRINNNLELLLDFKTDIGNNVPMTAMFVPSTGYIMSDKLPLIHDSYNDDLYFDNISQSLSLGNIQFIDLRQSFKTESENGAQLYYKTDHHWTTEGAYTAYCQYCSALGINAAPRSSFQIEQFDDFYGTTYSKSGFWFTSPDTIDVWNNPANTEDKIKVTINDTKPPFKERSSMFFYEHAGEDDKYPIFLDGNHAETVITNENAKGGTIIVIKDSFSHCFAPFLAENYSKVILLDMRYFNRDVTQIIQEENPDQVLVLYGIDNFATDTDIGHLWG